jgi:nucleoside-diphosphate-sugar epimerase
MKVFLTGATGVIGRRALPLLVSAGHEVTAIGRTPEKRAALEQMGAKAVDVSLFEPLALGAAVEGHDVVLNLSTHIPSSSVRMLLRGAWLENDRVRREGSANLVDAAIAGGVRRFVQESFAPVYPDCGSAWIDESVPIQPTRYNRTIADAERSAERFDGGMRSGIVLRFAAFYGSDARHVADMIRMVRRGWAPMPGSPDAYISSISHDDAASAVVAALGLPADVYNVTDDEPVSHREYFDSLAAALGVAAPKLPPPWATYLLGATGRLLSRSQRISNRKLRHASDWTPRYRSVREGWRSMIAALPPAGFVARPVPT